MALKSARPKKKNLQDTKEKLLKAALDVFSKDGFSGATTRNIAKKAGVNESLIQRYFEGKRGLFLAVRDRFRHNLIHEFLNYEASDDLEEEFVKFMMSRLHVSNRDKKFFKIALTDGMQNPKSREDVRKYAHTTPIALTERFERLRSMGKLRKDIDLEQMLSVLHTFAFAASILLNALEAIPEEEADSFIKSAAHMLVHGMKPQK